MKLRHRVRLSAGAFVMDNVFRGVAAAGRLNPMWHPDRHDVEVLRNLSYQPSGRIEHRLDVYRPRRRDGVLPAVLYVHGGAFRILSKDSHWMMGLAFARRGYVVFNISYRLAPRHPYPAAVEDACAAYRWVQEHAPTYGADPTRLVLAGESAGANLVTSLALAACYERKEPHARAVFGAGAVPRAVVAACGILQVSDPERFARRRPLPTWLSDGIVKTHLDYLGSFRPSCPEDLDLADPLCTLERGHRPARPLPPFFAPVGTADPLLDDTRRLAAALKRLDTPCDARFYPGEVHAFHAMFFRKAARQCWSECFAFLDRHLSAPAERQGAGGS